MDAVKAEAMVVAADALVAIPIHVGAETQQKINLRVPIFQKFSGGHAPRMACFAHLLSSPSPSFMKSSTLFQIDSVGNTAGIDHMVDIYSPS